MAVDLREVEQIRVRVNGKSKKQKASQSQPKSVIIFVLHRDIEEEQRRG